MIATAQLVTTTTNGSVVSTQVLDRARDASDRNTTYDEDATCSPRLVDVLSHVVHMLLRGAERLAVLKYRLGGIAVVVLGDEAPARADGGLEDNGIAKFHDGLERRI